MKTRRVCLLTSDIEVEEKVKKTLDDMLSKEGIELLQTDKQSAIEQSGNLPLVLSITLLSTETEFEWLAEFSESIKLCPIIVLDPSPSFDRATQALRNGAADYFALPLGSIPADSGNSFGKSISRQLYHSKLFSESQFYREELEHSLAVLQEDQQAGHHVQQKVLPPDNQHLNNYQFNYCLKPSLYLSGDYVDYFRISESLTMFYLADISGHGASSAFVTVLLKNMSNRLLRNYMRGSSFDILSPTDVLSRINKELLETGLGKHLTIFIGLLDGVENTLQYGVGGHFPMPILYQNGEAKYLPGGGMPAGLFDEAEFDGRVIELSEDFQLSIFSDGILEIMDAKNLDEKESMLLQACSKRYDCVSELLVSLGADDSIEAPDDIALLSVSRAV